MGKSIGQIILFFVFGLTNIFFSFAQKIKPDSTQKHHNFHKISMLLGVGGYVGTLFLLDKAWYKNGKTDFHFFNDNQNWQGIDKVGHAFSAFHLSRLNYALLKNSGLNENKSAILGGALGAFLLMPIEYFDGLSKDYGASWGDMLANLSGGVLFSVQQRLWHEQRFYLKYSYHQSDFSALRPALFGTNTSEKILKDYNGQTLWLSLHPNSFLKSKLKSLDYLQISLGYAGRNMLYANPDESFAQGFAHRRAYFLSLDLAWNKIQTKNKILKSVFQTFHLIKIPFPTLIYESGKLSFSPFYF